MISWWSPEDFSPETVVGAETMNDYTPEIFVDVEIMDCVPPEIIVDADTMVEVAPKTEKTSIFAPPSSEPFTERP